MFEITVIEMIHLKVHFRVSKQHEFTKTDVLTQNQKPFFLRVHKHLSTESHCSASNLMVIIANTFTCILH